MDPSSGFTGLDESLDHYVARLSQFVKEYLPPSLHASAYEMLDRLSQRVPPPMPALDLPRTIWTTDKSREGAPGVYHSWAKTHPGWDAIMMEDPDMEEFVGGFTQGSKLGEAWKSLPRAIYKADVVRWVRSDLPTEFLLSVDTSSSLSKAVYTLILTRP